MPPPQQQSLPPTSFSSFLLPLRPWTQTHVQVASRRCTQSSAHVAIITSSSLACRRSVRSSANCRPAPSSHSRPMGVSLGSACVLSTCGASFSSKEMSSPRTVFWYHHSFGDLRCAPENCTHMTRMRRATRTDQSPTSSCKKVHTVLLLVAISRKTPSMANGQHETFFRRAFKPDDNAPCVCKVLPSTRTAVCVRWHRHVSVENVPQRHPRFRR